MKAVAAFGLLALLAGMPAFSLGKNETGGESAQAETGKPVWAITAPASAFPGDCIEVGFSSNFPLADASVSILDQSGKTVAQIPAFDITVATEAAVTEPGGCAFTKIAIIGLSTQLEAGAYKVLAIATAPAGIGAIRSESPLQIEPKEFVSETIELDGTNTAIKTDDSPERAAQIKRLNDILFSLDDGAPRFAGPFRIPLDSTRRTAHFGDRRIYQYNNGKKEKNIHYGIDFGVPVGTPVFASGDGLVVMAEKRISTGWTVVVEHLPGVFSLYYHLDALCTAEGEQVRAGTLIGRSGRTGLATGPHLHWEFRVGGEAVSPDFFVGKKFF